MERQCIFWIKMNVSLTRRRNRNKLLIVGKIYISVSTVVRSILSGIDHLLISEYGDPKLVIDSIEPECLGIAGLVKTVIRRVFIRMQVQTATG